MSYSALSASFEYLCYGSTAISNILLFQCGDRLYTSESDVCRRQILTSNVGPALRELNQYDTHLYRLHPPRNNSQYFDNQVNKPVTRFQEM